MWYTEGHMENSLTLYGLPFIEAFFGALALGGIMIWLGKRWQTKNRRAPGEPLRKVSRLGGLAIIGAFSLVVLIHPTLVISPPMQGMLVGLVIIAILGLLDDIYNLPPVVQLTGQIAAAVAPMAGGLRLEQIPSPFGGAIAFDALLWGPIVLPETLIIVAWFVIMMNVLNWLDGIDGLASGVGSVAAITLFFLSLAPIVNQPPVAVLAIALFGALVGFLILNFPPARLFLGTSGSLAIGFILATLSVIAGSKLATAAFVLAIPLIDSIWVIWRRWRTGRPITGADFSHLHYRLRQRGMSQSQIVLSSVVVSAILGLAALSVGTVGKAIFVIALTSAAVIAALTARQR